LICASVTEEETAAEASLDVACPVCDTGAYWLSPADEADEDDTPLLAAANLPPKPDGTAFESAGPMCSIGADITMDARYIWVDAEDDDSSAPSMSNESTASLEPVPAAIDLSLLL